ncbi:MAG: flagellar hook protein [Ruminococcus flavefaciens]|nr:flagellar hook protein [Ruminococcus flavefaciens]
MVVQHNLTAMNSNRMLGLTTKTQAKSTEKLSSGYKINRAADDAAGLAISEKMRKQIRGLTQASANAQDGISAVQTAEGALNEVQDMLQRMNELAVKAANGTQSQSDRTAIQNEIDQLTTEIDRVAETTKFNETYLLKGDKDATKGYTYGYNVFEKDVVGTATFKKDTVSGLQPAITFEAAQADTMDAQNELAKALKAQGISVTGRSYYDTTAKAAKKEYSIELNGAAKEKFDVVVTDKEAGTFNITDKDGKVLAKVTGVGKYSGAATSTSGEFKDTVVFNATDVTVSSYSGGGIKAAYYDRDGNKISANDLGNYFIYDVENSTISVKSGVPKVYDAVGNETALNTNEITAVQDKVGALSLSLHVGADATSDNQITMSIENVSAKGLGIAGLKIDGTDDTNALSAIESIKVALQKVSDQRAELGAVQNRLEHTINNLDNVVENTTSAEAQIRDTDMATEMVKYSNNNILAQAGQAMLAQANQSNQGVLSLLG